MLGNAFFGSLAGGIAFFFGLLMVSIFCIGLYFDLTGERYLLSSEGWPAMAFMILLAVLTGWYGLTGLKQIIKLSKSEGLELKKEEK